MFLRGNPGGREFGGGRRGGNTQTALHDSQGKKSVLRNPGCEVISDGAIYGRAGVADDAWVGLSVFDRPARHKAEAGDMGIVLADRFRVSGVLLDVWADAVF